LIHAVVRAFAAGFRLQVRVVMSDPDYVMPLVTVPMFTITFLAIVREAGRHDLTSYALLAPVLIALWALSLFSSGEVIAEDRWEGTLEPAIASPSSFPAVVLGRIFAVTAIALIAFAEVALAAWLVFGIVIEIHHPLAFALTLAATVFAVSGTAVIMSALFVLSRSPRTFQNSLSFPFYVLGGVLVPVAFLPDWLEPVSRVVFLSWSADLLRASLAPAPVEDLAFRLMMIVVLGAAGFAVGAVLLRWILRRVRSDGSLTLT
jgi:ABC-2 type transport system permease protein